MGGLVMGKYEERQRKSCITKTNCKHFEKGYGTMFTHAMNFFKEHASLKKLILEHFFTSLFSDFTQNK
jgi:hypothetical protein